MSLVFWASKHEHLSISVGISIPLARYLVFFFYSHYYSVGHRRNMVEINIK